MSTRVDMKVAQPTIAGFLRELSCPPIQIKKRLGRDSHTLHRLDVLQAVCKRLAVNLVLLVLFVSIS